MLPLPGIQDFDAQTCFFQFQIHLTRLYLKTRKIIHQKSTSPQKNLEANDKTNTILHVGPKQKTHTLTLKVPIFNIRFSIFFHFQSSLSCWIERFRFGSHEVLPLSEVQEAWLLISTCQMLCFFFWHLFRHFDDGWSRLLHFPTYPHVALTLNITTTNKSSWNHVECPPFLKRHVVSSFVSRRFLTKRSIELNQFFGAPQQGHDGIR